MRLIAVLTAGLVTVSACATSGNATSSGNASTAETASAGSSTTATRMAADSCSDGGHGISVTFTNGTGQSTLTAQTHADGTWSDPFFIGDGQSWTGSSPYNCDGSTYSDVSVTFQYEMYRWHNNWVSVELKNHKGHSPDLRVCSLLGQSQEVWCDSFEGMLVGETRTMRPRTTEKGDVVGVVTVARTSDSDADTQYEISASCPDSGCTWPKPS